MDSLGSAVTANLPVWVWKRNGGMLDHCYHHRLFSFDDISLTNQWTGCSPLLKSFWTLRNFICRDNIQSQCFVSQHIVINMPRQGPRLCLISQYMLRMRGQLFLSEIITAVKFVVIQEFTLFFWVNEGFTYMTCSRSHLTWVLGWHADALILTVCSEHALEVQPIESHFSCYEFVWFSAEVLCREWPIHFKTRKN